MEKENKRTHQTRCIKYNGEVYWNRSDVCEMLLNIAALEQTDTKERIEEFVRINSDDFYGSLD